MADSNWEKAIEIKKDKNGTWTPNLRDMSVMMYALTTYIYTTLSLLYSLNSWSCSFYVFLITYHYCNTSCICRERPSTQINIFLMIYMYLYILHHMRKKKLYWFRISFCLKIIKSLIQFEENYWRCQSVCSINFEPWLIRVICWNFRGVFQVLQQSSSWIVKKKKNKRK